MDGTFPSVAWSIISSVLCIIPSWWAVDACFDAGLLVTLKYAFPVVGSYEPTEVVEVLAEYTRIGSFTYFRIKPCGEPTIVLLAIFIGIS
jgi:hypothetical protein